MDMHCKEKRRECVYCIQLSISTNPKRVQNHLFGSVVLLSLSFFVIKHVHNLTATTITTTMTITTTRSAQRIGRYFGSNTSLVQTLSDAGFRQASRCLLQLRTARQPEHKNLLKIIVFSVFDHTTRKAIEFRMAFEELALSAAQALHRLYTAHAFSVVDRLSPYGNQYDTTMASVSLLYHLTRAFKRRARKSHVVIRRNKKKLQHYTI